MVPTRLLHELSVKFDAPLTGVDLKSLRAAFAELVEQVLTLLTREKLDLDEVILEHAAVLRDTADAGAALVVLPTLNEPAGWTRAFDKCRRETLNLGPCSPESTRLDLLILRVRQELNSPLPDFRVADGC